uniref:V-SNARE coiled-coil homology domain-containing protein n=1 Tax=viral metagenome TaxID=1070528 RepID=A0A6C0IY54_9ZZZZ
MNNNINDLSKQVDETKHLLMKNCDKIIERGNNIDELDHKAAALNLSSVQFKKNTKTLKNKMWCQKNYCIFIVFTLLIIVILILVIPKKN